MEKIQLSTETICCPMPCSLVGVNVGGKPNYLTVAWFSMVNVKPPYLMIALGKAHYTNPGIKENGTFSSYFLCSSANISHWVEKRGKHGRCAKSSSQSDLWMASYLGMKQRQIDELIQTLNRLEELDNITELTRLLVL